MSSVALKVSVPKELLPHIEYLAEEDCTTIPRKIIELAKASLEREEDLIFGEIMETRLTQAKPENTLSLDQLKDAFSR